LNDSPQQRRFEDALNKLQSDLDAKVSQREQLTASKNKSAAPEGPDDEEEEEEDEDDEEEDAEEEDVAGGGTAGVVGGEAPGGVGDDVAEDMDDMDVDPQTPMPAESMPGTPMRDSLDEWRWDFSRLFDLVCWVLSLSYVYMIYPFVYFVITLVTELQDCLEDPPH